MHPELLSAYDRAVPMLHAREQLALVAAVAAGTGSLKDETREQLIADLRRDAQLPSNVERPRDADALSKALGASGIGLRRVTLRSAPDG